MQFNARGPVALGFVVLIAFSTPDFGVDASRRASSSIVAPLNRPVTKVVTLLKDMMVQLEKDAKEDEEIYNKLACWCTTNDKSKTGAISDAEAKIYNLQKAIEKATQLSARLATEIETLSNEVAAHEKALKEATAVREKEVAEFEASETEMLDTIETLKAAIAVLSKHHRPSMLQVPSGSLARVGSLLQDTARQSIWLQRGVITPEQQSAISSFIEGIHDPHTAQSGEIFGILEQLQETFEKDLADLQAEEGKRQKAYEEFKAAKEAEIAAANKQIEDKTEEKADTDQKKANDEQDLEDTKKTLSADQLFLVTLKEKCSLTDKEWEERQRTRALEIEAVSKALAVLSADDAHDTFTKTFNPSLLQESVASDRRLVERRARASDVLSKAARAFGSPRLSALAVRVRLDAFTRVKKAIDDMVAQLLKEKEDEIKHKDFCVKGINQNEADTATNTRTKSDLELKIEELTTKIETLAKEIAERESSVHDLQVQLKRATEDRTAESKEFQTTVADQRTTQRLLTSAKEILEGFYAKEGAFAQEAQEPAGPPPPEGFKTYKKSQASGGVLSMIQQIIEDAKAMEKQAVKDEEDALAAYAEEVKMTNNSIKQLVTEITNKSLEKAKTEEEKAETEASLKETMEVLDELQKENKDLHKACDYTLKNFDIRQKARDEEVEALKEAKAILSGSKFETFLQG